ncbi:disks large-associated protein 4 isoform X7 [Passer montanus]|uniref:disks large-associated protein 4 isoform X7 n=2 Tax=Passer TaxID=9159 RepID=UPI001960B4C9|nr:disks large-associated protein 4 isoform X7 [Passer montanus]
MYFPLHRRVPLGDAAGGAWRQRCDPAPAAHGGPTAPAPRLEGDNGTALSAKPAFAPGWDRGRPGEDVTAAAATRRQSSRVGWERRPLCSAALGSPRGSWGSGRRGPSALSVVRGSRGPPRVSGGAEGPAGSAADPRVSSLLQRRPHEQPERPRTASGPAGGSSSSSSPPRDSGRAERPRPAPPPSLRSPPPLFVSPMALCLELLRQCSSCLVAYKKTPPPVPPRTTSKPFISVTVQSSTESAQDTYLDSQDHKSEVTSQSGLSNSSDSLDSTRTPSVTRGSVVTPARDTPELPQKNATLKSDKGTLTNEEPKVENIPKRKLSSIGIQVDCLQPVAKEEPPPPATKFQSIGVQVEDEWRNSHSRSMSSKQDTDSDTQEPNNSSCKSSERSLAECPQHNNSVGVDASTRQPAKPSQIKRNLSYGENNDPALEPSSLPPPDPWLESCSTSPSEPAQAGPCRRDGFWFLKLLQAETERLEGWCRQMDQETKENNLSEEVLGKVLSAVGSAQLLMSQKFQQFHGLCEQNLNPNANPRPTAQDLAGFWDLLQLSIEDISMKFDELYHLKANSWQLAETPERKEEKKPPPPVPKKPAKSKSQLGRDKGSDPDKQRQEARKRLMAAKRAASVRQNSATESADSIEIYVPEAQTRL